METLSIAGSKYFVWGKNNFSHYHTVFFLNLKNKVFDKFILLLNISAKATKHFTTIVRSDNGNIVVNKTKDPFHSWGICHQRTMLYSPHNTIAK